MTMKKVILSVFVVVLLSSCSVAMKEVSQSFTYKDPQTIGGRWTVHFPDGTMYENAKCTYWGTGDDTSVWKLEDETTLIQSGTVWATKKEV